MTLTREQIKELKKLPLDDAFHSLVLIRDGYQPIMPTKSFIAALEKLWPHLPALIEMAEDAIKWRELCDCVVEGQYTTLNYEDREIVMTARNK